MLESFLQLLSGDAPHEVVWTADITYWLRAHAGDANVNPDWHTEEGYLELCRGTGTMPYYWYERFWLGEPVYDQTISVSVERDGNATKRTWTTPLGDLTEIVCYMPESSSTAHVKFAVASAEDLGIWVYLIEHRLLDPSCTDDYRERMELWSRYDGLPSIALPRSPLPAFFYEWAGVQNAVFLLSDHRERIAEMFDLMEQQERVMMESVCELAPPVVMFADNLSSDNMTGYYDEHIGPRHRRRIECLHRVETKCAVHLDGAVRGLLPKLVDAGFDAVEALTPRPGGDLPVEHIRETALDENVILWGGVPGILFAPPYSWSDLCQHVHHVLDCWRGSRFILGVGDQIPPDGDLGACARIAELINEGNQ